MSPRDLLHLLRLTWLSTALVPLRGGGGGAWDACSAPICPAGLDMQRHIARPEVDL